MIRLVFEVTADQFALIESAERLVRARGRMRMSRGAVLAEMATSLLERSPARTRSRYLPLVQLAAGGEEGWYDTGRGMLPVHPDILRQAMDTARRARQRPTANALAPLGREGAVDSVQGTSGCPTSDGPVSPDSARPGPSCSSKSRQDEPLVGRGDPRPGARRAIPQATLRALYALADHRCQCCGSKGPLIVHHRIPVSEGGGDELENLRLLCHPCHQGEHEEDYASRPAWRSAKEAALRSRPVPDG